MIAVRARVFLAGILLLAARLAAGTDAAKSVPSAGPAALPPATAYVQVSGAHLVAPGGSALHLRGINLGNWLLPEGYLWRFHRTNSPRMIETAVAELLGDMAAARFWAEWRDNYVTADDIAFIHLSGLNCVRVPLDWRLFMTDGYPHKIEGPGWALLDRLVGWCRDNQVYAVLDLHAAPGGQTGDNIDDSRGRPLLFTDAESEDLTIQLWRALAERYRGETIVAGYDLLNEPIATYFDKEKLNPLLVPLYKRLVAAVREADPRHVIFLGGAQWDTNLRVLGAPFAPNLAYTFHIYRAPAGPGTLRGYLELREEWGVPLFLGESGENSDAWIGDFRRLLDADGIDWTFWPYKKLVSTSCMVTVEAPADWDKVVAFVEAPRGSYEEIRKALPPEGVAEAAFARLLQNIRFGRAKVNDGYVKALTSP